MYQVQNVECMCKVLLDDLIGKRIRSLNFLSPDP